MVNLDQKGKIIGLTDWLKHRQKYQKNKIVLVGGVFDVLHLGHIQLLQKAKEKGDLLVVALESDETVEKKKKKKAFHKQNERAQILAALSFVDLIIELPYFAKDNDYFELVKNIKPSVIAVTEGDPQTVNKRKQAEAVGGQVIEVTPLIKGFSSSNLIKNAALSSD